MMLPFLVVLCSEESLAAVLHSHLLLMISSIITVRECLLDASGNVRGVMRGLQLIKIDPVLLSMQSLSIKISQRACKAVYSKALLDENSCEY